jgi:hypothetical protein
VCSSASRLCYIRIFMPLCIPLSSSGQFLVPSNLVHQTGGSRRPGARSPESSHGQALILAAAGPGCGLAVAAVRAVSTLNDSDAAFDPADIQSQRYSRCRPPPTELFSDPRLQLTSSRDHLGCVLPRRCRTIIRSPAPSPSPASSSPDLSPPSSAARRPSPPDPSGLGKGPSHTR